VRGGLPSADPRPRVEALAGLHSLRATEAYDAAAALVAGWAREAGLRVETEDFPADGRARYGPFLSEPGFRVAQAELRQGGPDGRVLASYRESPLALAWFSGSADVTAELVDVGAGVAAADYEGKDVRGKIVLADGPHAVVHSLAVWERGAVGVASDWQLFPDRYPDVLSSDGAGVRPWVGPDGAPPGFVFEISARTAAELRRELAASRGPVELRARVSTETYPSHYRVVSARIAGVGRSSEEVLIVNHLDSTSPGAVHNAAAALTLLDAAASLAALVRSGALAPPSRTIHFLWVPEHRGTMAYLLAHPELSDRVVAAMNVDMPAARHSATGAVTHLYRTPDSRPSFTDDLFGELLEWLRDENTVPLGGDGFSYPVVSPFGTAESFEANVASFEGLSDHVEFLAAGIPMGFFGAWPFDFLGTTGDTLEVYDATQSMRVSFILAAGAYAVASASREDVVLMGESFLLRAEKRLLDRTSLQIGLLARAGSDDEIYDAYASGAEALFFALDREKRALATLSRLADGRDESLQRELQAAGDGARTTLESAYRRLCSEKGVRPRGAPPTLPALRPGEIVPKKTGALLGPLTSELLRDRLGRQLTDDESALFARNPYAAFEAWNFVDGARSVGDIRGAAAAELGEVRLEDVRAFFRVLDEAGLVRLRSVP
jgi:Peptidase family M28